MQNIIGATVTAIASGGISFLAITGGFDTVETITSPPERRLQIVELSFDNGVFTQSSRVTGAQSLKGEWAAKITRGANILCSGGAASNYSTKTHVMDPDTWTGGDCPDIEPGDVASASWEYRDENGFVHVISKEIIIE